MKRVAVVLTAILVVWLLVAHFVVPGMIERRVNRITTSTGAAPPQAQELHRRLLIADLHADSLLWGRDLLRRSDRGHVDLPRLEAGNAALQVFSIVTKVPKGANTERNSAGSDLITQLALAEAWPPNTWFSLKARALYQAERLRDTADRSRGKLVLIRKRSNLERHLQARAAGSRAVAGILAVEGAHALQGNLENLNHLFEAGIRMVSPTHFFDTDLAGSSSGVTRAA